MLIGMRLKSHLKTVLKLFMIKKISILLIKIYQNSFSLFFPSSCRYNPSCSQYMIDSINKNGLLNGIHFGVKRILRCHPFSKKGGYDPV